MPEGDTVHLLAAKLDAALAGQRLLATDFRVPRFATRTWRRWPLAASTCCCAPTPG